ncbi:MAG: outer membrane beta-barrel protein [Bacteroidota bacterium]|nr:outer membrane beta-barrel protein [Bacteroidota bacterium]MDP4234129.1 outer membrane beta-barrel protein [Bacteroidota bacterium]MDP4243070.1 outer membrane beta-barrel protein [Bacteroidota bacterium]MDP4287496.1 outer membrane beta-barrel protein [Bacteroidota bacterium]
MRTRLFLLLSACAFVVLAGRVDAQSVIVPTVQTGFLIGPVGGINLVAYSSDAFPILNSEPSCFQAQNGSDVAPWGGLSFEYPLGNAQELQNFIVAEVLYDSKSSKFTSLSAAQQTTPTKKNGVTADGTVNTSLDANLGYLDLFVGYKYNFTPGPSPVGPGIQVGPAVGIKMSAKFDKTVTVTASSGVSSNPTSTSTVTQTVDVQGFTMQSDGTRSQNGVSANALRIALRAAATYDIPFSQEWIGTPIVGYDFPITKVENSRNWRASSAFGGIAFRYFIRG